MKFLIAWITIGIIVGYLKLRQSKQPGFERSVTLATLPYIIIGIFLWPILLFYIFSERKIHREAYFRSRKIRTELDEIEKQLSKPENEDEQKVVFTRNIKCGACGYKGKVEAHDTVNVFPESEIFKNLGKDSSTGFLHFRCPSCNEDLAVDPLNAIAAKQMVGYRESLITLKKVQRSNRHMPIIWGIICLIAAIFIFVKFRGWWTYLVGGLLLMLAWVSLKTGIFASKKEIKELTEPGPLPEDTKRKFQDRL